MGPGQCATSPYARSDVGRALRDKLLGEGCIATEVAWGVLAADGRHCGVVVAQPHTQAVYRAGSMSQEVTDRGSLMVD